ncbi:tetratricopeptide repeat protein [Cytobacillus purgationiresistens]|uniref:Tetratricopeptide (TPR) repeat protein n=1 Tax=Cytobacillus purgationiresistens TaxID=863449 RepID=A0ABU0AL44_9BACI|nr:tetratricopeptide repeat protein [Cytobacillus purgationiresistens]MDQ0271988.1 tetratricopeptide (TPR) repeat protein [Cytobacillus purgationiresistens]
MKRISELKQLVNGNQYEQALQIVADELSKMKSMKLSELKQVLQGIQAIEDFHMLIKLLDRGLMYKHSSFLARYAHMRFHSLQTMIWYSEELIERAKPIEALEEISACMREEINEETNKELVVKAMICEIHCLIELRRFNEVREKIAALFNIEKHPALDKLAYIYMQMEEKSKAEELLKKGIENDEYGAHCYWILSDYYASAANYSQAVHVINEGLVRFPSMPGLILAKVKRLSELEKWDEMLVLIDQLNEMLPYHHFHDYFLHLHSVSLYRTEKLSELKTLTVEQKLRDTPFSFETFNIDKNEKSLEISPIIQESNYCVPASVEMISAFYGERKVQKDVAHHIFDVTGSKLSTTVSYLESQGYHCQYFIGNHDVYSTLLEKGIPILLSVDMENYSHVQILKGYDDRFSIYHIQDPNLFETLYVGYDEFDRKQKHTAFMSIAIVPEEKSAILDLLDKEEDQYFRELHRITDGLDNGEERFGELYQYLKKNLEFPYTPIYVMNSIFDHSESPFIHQCIEIIMEKYQEEDYYTLHAAESYLRLEIIEKASELLQSVRKKTYSPYYHFLKGQIELHQNQYMEAVSSFKLALELDSDQMQLWSYIAISYCFAKDIPKARKLSDLAMNLYGHDRFTRFNHALILSEQGKNLEANTIYDLLIKENSRDGQAWFERARIDHTLNKLKRAERGFKIAVSLEPDFQEGYIALADLYMDQLRMEEAVKILVLGIEQCEDCQLYFRLGNILLEQEEWSKAEELYTHCLDKFPQEALSFIGYASVLSSVQGKDAAISFIRGHRSDFEGDAEYFIYGGKLIGETGKSLEEEHLIREGLDYIESCIPSIKYDIDDALEIYTELVIDSPFVKESRKFLLDLTTSERLGNEFHCYTGLLFDVDGLYVEALALYKQAITIVETSFPYYQMGETYFKMKQYQLAAKAYHQSLHIDPTLAGSYSGLAQIAAIKGDQAEEINMMKQLLEHSPLGVNMEYFFSILSEKEVHDCLHHLQEREGKVDPAWLLESMAKGFIELGDLSRAERHLHEALAIMPDHPHIQLSQFKLEFKLKRWTEAKKTLLHILEENPENEEIYDGLINLIDQTGKWMQLSDTIDKLAKRTEEKSEVYLQAAKALDSYFDEMDKSEEQVGFHLGKIFGKLKEKSKQAIISGTIVRFYEKAVKLDPDNMEAASRLASFYENAGLFDEAEKVLAKAYAHAGHAEISLQLGQLYLTKGEMTGDEADLLQSIKQMNSFEDNSRNTVEALIIKGNAYNELGEVKKAEKCYKTVIKKVSSNIEAHYRLGNLLNGSERHEEAIQVLKVAIDIFPEDIGLSIEIGVAYNHAGKPELALNVFEDLIAHDEQIIAAYYFKACSLALLKRDNEANKLLQYVFKNDEEGIFEELAETDVAIQEMYARM